MYECTLQRRVLSVYSPQLKEAMVAQLPQQQHRQTGKHHTLGTGPVEEASMHTQSTTRPKLFTVLTTACVCTPCRHQHKGTHNASNALIY